MFAGVGLKLSGEEAMLLGYVSVVSCWSNVLLKETVQVLLEIVDMDSRF